MNKININLENCYGIKKLQEKLDFSARKLIVIYAPNGSMKTSFSKTFHDLSIDQPSEDRIHGKKKKTIREIKDESGLAIDKDKVFVIESYNPNYKSKKISTLLANKTLKEKYDLIYSAIDEKKEALINELKESSGLKNAVEETLSLDIAHTNKDFFKALTRIESEVLKGKDQGLGRILYQKIFNDKVRALLESPGFKEKLSEYMKIYDRLISESRFFRKGIFNHNNATDIAKN